MQEQLQQYLGQVVGIYTKEQEHAFGVLEKVGDNYRVGRSQFGTNNVKKITPITVDPSVNMARLGIKIGSPEEPFETDEAVEEVEESVVEQLENKTEEVSELKEESV